MSIFVENYFFGCKIITLDGKKKKLIDKEKFYDYIQKPLNRSF